MQFRDPTMAPHRRLDLTVEELDGEGLLYDPRSGRVHHLNAVAFVIWSACDRGRLPEDVTTLTSNHFGMSAETARAWAEQALDQLRHADLLDEPRARRASERVEQRRSTAGENEGNLVGLQSAEIEPASRDPQLGPPDPSRRDFLDGGVSKFLVAAPIVSTFIASGANASGPSFSSAFGADGCKNVGYSCAVDSDCCDGGTRTACEDQGGPVNSCCVQHNETGCANDSDCCDPLDTCSMGTCE